MQSKLQRRRRLPIERNGLQKLLVQGGQRDLVVRKLRTVTPLIEELSTIK